MYLLDYYFNRNNRLLGEDSRMSNCWKFNFIPVTFFFKEAIPDFKGVFLNYLLKKLNDKNDRLRLIESKGKYSYCKKPTKSIVDSYYEYHDNVHWKIDDDHVLKQAIDSNRSGYFYVFHTLVKQQ